MGILFDLDGTLLDTAPDFISVIEQIRQEEGLPALDEDLIYKLRLSVSESTASVIKAGLNIDAIDPQYPLFRERFIRDYQKILGQYTKPFPGIEDLLRTLEQRQIPWGIVTNKPGFLTEPLLQQQGLYKRAACVISGDSTPTPKPHPAPLLMACQQMQVSANDCLYIGDAERDIIAGNAAGMTTITALFGYIDNIELAKAWAAHHSVHHADEILPWFIQWSDIKNDSITA